MREGTKGAIKTVASGVCGAGVGAGVYGVIGGVGLAVGGTAVGLTLGPFIAIGTGIGTLGYGIYWLGKEVGGKAKPGKVRRRIK